MSSREYSCSLVQPGKEGDVSTIVQAHRTEFTRVDEIRDLPVQTEQHQPEWETLSGKLEGQKEIPIEVVNGEVESFTPER